MKKYLIEELEKIANQTETKLLYVPEEFAVVMNLLGLANVVFNEELFEFLLELQETKKSQLEVAATEG